MPIDNIEPLRINSRCPAINSSILSYSRYYYSINVGRKSQFKVITSISVIYQCRGAHNILENRDFSMIAPLDSRKPLVKTLPL